MSDAEMVPISVSVCARREGNESLGLSPWLRNFLRSAMHMQWHRADVVVKVVATNLSSISVYRILCECLIDLPLACCV